MDILGTKSAKERDKLQRELQESLAVILESHEMIRESHKRFIEALDAAVVAAATHTRAAVAASPSLFSQNRVRRPIEGE